LREGFDIISTIVEKLAILKTTKDHAKEIYKKMKDSNSIRGQNNNVLATACLYIACRLEKESQTFKELVAATNGYMEIRDISHTSKRILQKLQENCDFVNMGEMNATTYLRRFCSNLQMSNDDVKAVFETITNSKNTLDIRRTPMAMVAATIFMITQLSRCKRSLTEISKATNVGEATISSTYKDSRRFYLLLTKLFHNGFGNS